MNSEFILISIYILSFPLIFYIIKAEKKYPQERKKSVKTVFINWILMVVVSAILIILTKNFNMIFIGLTLYNILSFSSVKKRVDKIEKK